METKAQTAVKVSPADDLVDIADIDVVKGANTGVEVQLYHPGNSKDLGIFVTVLGKDSDEYERKATEQNRDRLTKMQKGGFRPGTLSPDDIKADAIELLAACTTGWRNMKVGGELIPFSRDNAVMVYTKYPWIREQVDQAVSDRSLFIKA